MDVNAELAKRQQQLIRDEGMCGALSLDGRRICVLQPGHSEPHPWDAVSGPLEREFARLHTYIDTDGLVVTREDAKAALSAIERHVQDMEKALEKIISLMSSSEESWEDPVQIARAALPAREKGTE